MVSPNPNNNNNNNNRWGVSVQCRDGATTHSSTSTYVDRLLLIPGLLEYGAPSHDVWPDNPEWEERQITCDFGVRVLRPGLFCELVVRLNSAEGRRQLRIVADPLPVFLSHHAVFFAAVDQVRGIVYRLLDDVDAIANLYC